MDLRLEVIQIPVSDLDRAKKFYQEQLGWKVDADLDLEGYTKLLGFKPPFPADFRALQLTPPGSACSVHLAKSEKPGSLQGIYLVTSDIEATRSELLKNGVDVSQPFHYSPEGQKSGVHPEHQSYNSYMSFRDPDGNSWLVQEIKKRLPGRGSDVATLADLLHETSEHHGRFEATHAKHNWWDWYAPYLNARENGNNSEQATTAADRYMKDTHNI